MRRDVLEEQIASASMGSQMNIPGEVSVGSNVDIEKDGAMLLDLIDRAKPYKTFPRELWNILYEEEDLYLSGSIILCGISDIIRILSVNETVFCSLLRRPDSQYIAKRFPLQQGIAGLYLLRNTVLLHQIHDLT